MTPDGAQTPYRAALGRLRGSFIQAGLFSAAINLLMLTGPLYMLQIYDRVLASGSVPTLMGLFAIVVLLYAFLGAYDFFRARILSRAAYRFDKLIGEAAFQHLLAVEGQGKSSSALRDLDIMRGFLSGPAIRGLFDMPWIPIFLIAVFIIHPYLGYLTLAGAGIVVSLALLTQWATKAPTERSAQSDGMERGFTNQTLRNAEVVRALGMAGTMTARWRRMHDGSLVHVQSSGDRSDGFSAGSRAFRLLLQSMLLTGGAYLALQQQISAGMIVGTSILAGRALAPVDQVIGQWRGIARAFESHKRLRAALDDNATATDPLQLPTPHGEVSLNGVVKFMPHGAQGAKGERGRILDQVSFDLAAGDVLGVIGNSASGKSSLARMLVGAWQPDAGSVRLDGATLDQWAPDALGQHIGYLPQHVEMLPGTIGENIARFEPGADEDEIFKAAQLAGVHDLILGLPQGYGTPVGMPGQPLSGGQMQRIGLARALYKTPKLIVLDEPNAHLDMQGDEALTDTIAQLKAQGSTVIIMAHRPGVLAETNKVLILHQGRVAQFGSREEIFRMAVRSVPNAPNGSGETGSGGNTSRALKERAATLKVQRP